MVKSLSESLSPFLHTVALVFILVKLFVCLSEYDLRLMARKTRLKPYKPLKATDNSMAVKL